MGKHKQPEERDWLAEDPRLDTSCDLSEVRGGTAMLDTAELLVRAVAERRHVLLVGPPGVGKTLLARRAVGIMPPPSDHEARWIAAEREFLRPAITGRRCDTVRDLRRPFRAPHYTISAAALTGTVNAVRLFARAGECKPEECDRGPTGKSLGYRTVTITRPGELHLARFGVLLLDEVMEFSRLALGTLAERHRAMAGAPLIIATAQPCPCGWYGSPVRQCACSEHVRARYAERLFGVVPILGITARIAMPALSWDDLRAGAELPATSAAYRERVTAAWQEG